MLRSLVGSEMCIRDRYQRRVRGFLVSAMLPRCLTVLATMALALGSSTIHPAALNEADHGSWPPISQEDLGEVAKVQDEWSSTPPRRTHGMLGEGRLAPCKTCEQMGRVFGIDHHTAGKPPSWGQATEHAKGCWIAMDCNLAAKKTAGPGIRGFRGEDGKIPTVSSPASDNDVLENGQISPEQAAFKPVESELTTETINRQIDWETIVHDTMFSTVQVRIIGETWDWSNPSHKPGAQKWSGTGWFIAHSELGDYVDPDDLLLITNAHVAADALRAVITVPSAGNHEIPVEVVGTSVQRDLAMLRVSDPEKLAELVQWTPAMLQLGDSDAMRRAGQVMVLGYPLGLAGVKSSMGFVSGYQQFQNQLYLQVTAPIDGGNSGGPLLDTKGRVIGVVSAKIAQASGMSFAIPAVELKALLKVLYQQRIVRSPLIGLSGPVTTSRHVRSYFNIPDDVGTSPQDGLLIEFVPRSSLLDMAGVQAGDVLLTVDGCSVDRFSQVYVQEIEDRVHIGTFLARKTFNEQLQLSVWRENELHDLNTVYTSTSLLDVPRVLETVASNPQAVSFAGVSMMNLTENIVDAMLNPTLARFLDPDERLEAYVVVVHVAADSPAGIDGSIQPGMLIKQVNGIHVRNLHHVCTAMDVDEDGSPGTAWQTIHSEKGMLILKTEEIMAYECTNTFASFSFPQPNRLCSWKCPQVEPVTDPNANSLEIPKFPQEGSDVVEQDVDGADDAVSSTSAVEAHKSVAKLRVAPRTLSKVPSEVQVTTKSAQAHK
eukprot:TRINITY_DN1038_c0_g1_i2.p1 TRINITY_DN1038_c0_g1~~TRINITY_DN1038_c0_g1_i2.p1  ORF type:complete len:784 (-),score=206.35 TRINITY_DN1038_c0_g1_i2:295-2601(-)